MTFEEWFNSFQKDQNGKQALEKLESLNIREPFKFDYFKGKVLDACYFAWKYENSSQNDPGKILRQQIKDLKDEIPSQLKAIAKLRNFIKNHKKNPALQLFKPYFFFHLRDKDIYLKSCNGEDLAGIGVLDDILEAFHKTLYNYKVPSFGDRARVGCLYYPYDLGEKAQNRKPNTATMLAFNLVLLFRYWSFGEVPYCDGFQMPEGGNPNYELVASFVAATLNEEKSISAEIVKNSVKDLLSRTPTINLVSWPDDDI